MNRKIFWVYFYATLAIILASLLLGCLALSVLHPGNLVRSLILISAYFLYAALYTAVCLYIFDKMNGTRL